MLKNKQANSEWKRKLLHLALTGFPLSYAWFPAHLFVSVHILVIITFTSSWYISEFFRTRMKTIATPTGYLLSNISRKSTDPLQIPFKHPNWLIGYLIASICLSANHIIAGILTLSLGDSTAAFVGANSPTRTLRGSIAGFIVSAGAILFITDSTLIAFTAAGFGMTAERFTHTISDNYTIPPSSSLGSFIVSRLVGLK